MYATAIAQYVEENGIKQTYLVGKTGISAQAMSALMNGRRGLSVEEYAAICEALGVDLNFFMGRVKMRKADPNA